MSYWFRHHNAIVAQIIKADGQLGNPYHDAQGLFTTAANATGFHEKPVPAIEQKQNSEVANKAYALELAHVYADKAKEEEPKVTKDLQSSLSGDAHMEGLDFKLKTLASLSDKIFRDSISKNTSLAEAASSIRDALRYTVVAPTNELTQTVKDTLAKLKDEGYTRTAFRNIWGPDKVYQGINANFKTPSGYEFELQFHTPESFDVKQNVNHALYEKARVEPQPPDDVLDKLNDQMIENQKRVTMPPGIKDIT